MSLSTSINPGGYGGVRSPNPPTVWFVPRDPTVNDWQNKELMDEWCNIAQGVTRWFKLLSLENNQAIWSKQDSLDDVNGLIMQTGTSPVLPNSITGLITLSGAVVAAGTNPIRSDGTGPTTATIEVQISQAIASTNAANIGLSAFNSAHFSVDANGFVSLLGGGQAIDSLTPNSGTTPIVPDANGNVNLLGTGSITVVGSLNTGTIQLTGLTNHAVLVGAGTATITNVGPTATTGQVLQNNAGADPSYSTATYPSTTTINEILYSSANNTIGGITAGNNGVLISGTTGIPSWLSNSGTPGFVLTANAGAPPSWQANGTGNVSGPGSSTDRAISTWNGTGGNALFDNPGVTINSAGDLIQSRSQSGGQVTMAVNNTANTASSSVVFSMNTAGTSAGNNVFSQTNTVDTAWAFGITSATNSSWSLSANSTLNVNNVLVANYTTRNVDFPVSISLAGGTALNNYTEGTFTPTMAFGGASVGITYVTQQGKYTRIGNVVHFFIQIQLSSKGSSTGSATLSSLPFTSNGTYLSTSFFVPGNQVTLTVGQTIPVATIGASSTTISLQQSDVLGNPVANLADTNFGNGATFYINGFYFTS